jgi:hypothetical protein
MGGLFVKQFIDGRTKILRVQRNTAMAPAEAS